MSPRRNFAERISITSGWNIQSPPCSESDHSFRAGPIYARFVPPAGLRTGPALIRCPRTLFPEDLPLRVRKRANSSGRSIGCAHRRCNPARIPPGVTPNRPIGQNSACLSVLSLQTHDGLQRDCFEFCNQWIRFRHFICNVVCGGPTDGPGIRPDNATEYLSNTFEDSAAVRINFWRRR